MTDEIKKIIEKSNCCEEKLYLTCVSCSREDPEALQSLLSQSHQQGRMEATEEWKQFILNILDGIDKADEQAGVTGGTKAIRLAIQSRV